MMPPWFFTALMIAGAANTAGIIWVLALVVLEIVK